MWPFKTDTSPASVATIDATDAFERARKGAKLIDVRSDREWQAGRAKGSRHVTPDKIAADATGLRRDDEVLVICASGARSARAARQLARTGFTNVSNVAGGLHAWQRAGLPVKR